MELLPLELQYLPADKQREPEAAIRKTLLEIILQVKKIHREMTPF